MKKSIFSKLLFCGAIFLFSSFVSDHQSKCYWVGGTPGCETDWDNPRNWSTNRVPDWTYDAVIIPDVTTRSNHFPVITNSVYVIAHLQVESHAVLSVEGEGHLLIEGDATFNYGIINGGKIINRGFISVSKTGLANLLDLNGVIINEGTILLQDNNYPFARKKMTPTGSGVF